MQIHERHIQASRLTVNEEFGGIRGGVCECNLPFQLAQAGHHEQQAAEQKEGVHRDAAALEQHRVGCLGPGDHLVRVDAGRQQHEHIIMSIDDPNDCQTAYAMQAGYQVRRARCCPCGNLKQLPQILAQREDAQHLLRCFKRIEMFSIRP